MNALTIAMNEAADEAAEAAALDCAMGLEVGPRFGRLKARLIALGGESREECCDRFDWKLDGVQLHAINFTCGWVLYHDLPTRVSTATEFAVEEILLEAVGFGR